MLRCGCCSGAFVAVAVALLLAVSAAAPRAAGFHLGGDESVVVRGMVAAIREQAEAEDAARFAVDDHNRKNQGAALEFARLVNAKRQVVTGTLHDLTLEVVDSGKKSLYSAKLFGWAFVRNGWFVLCRRSYSLVLWGEIGQNEAERDRMMLQLEEDCLNNPFCSGEQEAFSRVEKLGGTLMEQLTNVEPVLEDLRRRRDERIKDFTVVQLEIVRLHAEISGTIDQGHPAAPLVDETNLSLSRLGELKRQLNELQTEKLQDLGSTLIELWNLMDTPIDEQKCFDHVTSLMIRTAIMLAEELTKISSALRKQDVGQQNAMRLKKLQEHFAAEQGAIFGTKPSPVHPPSARKPLGQSSNVNIIGGTPTSRRVCTPMARKGWLVSGKVKMNLTCELQDKPCCVTIRTTEE
ncbi:hypothetical protein GUJ93_ZPchr0010g9278 [Zizania palustris]|uniref:Cystatin domain-containing protein n=1 Tax=Zizania palustris TaxID=103762 RepID=A0A8J5W9T8_ZIZPA|nr:hypothetical protein GUJ93_ZPchr0010g9278 [Zizania palustris]